MAFLGVFTCPMENFLLLFSSFFLKGIMVQSLEIKEEVEKYVSIFPPRIHLVRRCLDNNPGKVTRCSCSLIMEAMLAATYIALVVIQLESEVKNGTWKHKYGHLLKLNEFDLGYSLVVWQKATDG
jgi:hypothetical protein